MRVKQYNFSSVVAPLKYDKIMKTNLFTHQCVPSHVTEETSHSPVKNHTKTIIMNLFYTLIYQLFFKTHKNELY